MNNRMSYGPEYLEHLLLGDLAILVGIHSINESLHILFGDLLADLQEDIDDEFADLRDLEGVAPVCVVLLE